MDAGIVWLTLITVGLMVVVPVAGIVAWAVVANRKDRRRHEERLAMIERGLVPSDVPPPLPPPPPAQSQSAPSTAPEQSSDDIATGLGWAAGIFSAGVLFLFGDFNFLGVIVTACVAGYLTRGLVGLSRSKSSGTGGMR
jgi:hypothetical protein